MCSFALPVFPWAEKVDMQALEPTAGKPAAACPTRADWIAMALPMTGQRRAKTCNLDMVPPHGETAVGAAVDMARRPAAVAFFMKGHMALDWRRTESIAAISSTRPNSIRLLRWEVEQGFRQRFEGGGGGRFDKNCIFPPSSAKKRENGILDLWREAKAG